MLTLHAPRPGPTRDFRLGASAAPGEQDPKPSAPKRSLPTDAGRFTSFHVEHGVGGVPGVVTHHRRRREPRIPHRAICRGHRSTSYSSRRPAEQYIGSDERRPRCIAWAREWDHVRRARRPPRPRSPRAARPVPPRELVAGHAYNKDSAWQQELEASFPMWRPKINCARSQRSGQHEQARRLDRLICGSGLWQDRSRAARRVQKRCRMASKWPCSCRRRCSRSTHYGTFQSRLSPFPVNVEMPQPLSLAQVAARHPQAAAGKAGGHCHRTHRLLKKTCSSRTWACS